MKLKTENHVIDILFVIALFCIFALAAIFLITIGGNIYGKTASHMESNFNGRTSFAYVTEKIRQADEAGSVSVGSLDGIPALLLKSKQKEVEYITYIYAYEGYLKELLVRQDTPVGAFAGQNILPVTEFSLSQVSDRLYEFQITAENADSFRILVSTKAKGGNADE